MRIAVIGSSGQLGSELMLEGKKLGHKMLGFKHTHIEVADASSLHPLMDAQPDVVVNTAALHDLQKCERQPAKAWDVNTAIPLVQFTDVLGDCVYIYVSTDYVFDGVLGNYSETAPCRPKSVYGMTKRAGELAALSILGEKAAICRVSYLYGKKGCRGKGGGNFIDFLARAAREGRHLELDADTRFSPTYAKSAAQRICEVAVRVREGNGGIYHCAGGGACSHHTLGYAVAEMLHKRVDFAARTGSPDELRPKQSDLLNTRLADAPDWREEVSQYLRERGWASPRR